jgi:hypothetical protein
MHDDKDFMQLAILPLTVTTSDLIGGNPMLFFTPNFDGMTLFASFNLITYNLPLDLPNASNLTPSISNYLELYS